MIRARNLHFSSLLRSVLPIAAIACAALCQANEAPNSGNLRDLIPSTGARPELLTVLDMRKDEDLSHRLLARSAQGLMNSEDNRTDKIYLILNDQDESWLNWLVKQQYVLSVGHMRNLEELLRRYPRRDAMLSEGMPISQAALVAGRKRLLLAADKKVVKEFDLRVNDDDIDDLMGWNAEGYRYEANRSIIAITPDEAHTTDLIDYQIANRVATFDLVGDASDAPKIAKLKERYENIPCLVTGAVNPAITEALSSIAIFQIPVGGLSNLSFWTTFRPYGRRVDETSSGATNQPRSRYISDKHTPTPWDKEESVTMKSKLPWLRELAPPIFESWIRGLGKDGYGKRDDLRMGVINEAVYGSAYGADRDRVWLDYLRLSRRSHESVTGY